MQSSTLLNCSHELLKCEICTFDYNIDERKAYILIPCGHTLCNNCIDKIPNRKCPNDRIVIQSKVINWELMKIVSNNLINTKLRNNMTILKLQINELTSIKSQHETKIATSMDELKKSIDKLKRNDSKVTGFLRQRLLRKLNSITFRIDKEFFDLLEFKRNSKAKVDIINEEINDIYASNDCKLVELNSKLELEIGAFADFFSRIERNFNQFESEINEIKDNIGNESFLVSMENSLKAGTSADELSKSDKNQASLNELENQGKENTNPDNESPVTENTNSSLFDQFTIKKKTILVLLITVVLPVLLAYPITTIFMGIYYLNECKISKRIPLWLTIYGIFGCLIVILSIILIEYLYIRKNLAKSYVTLSLLLTALFLCTAFNVIWFFYGNYLVFSVYTKVEYSETIEENKENNFYCNPTLYLFSFLTIILPYIFTFILVILIASFYYLYST